MTSKINIFTTVSAWPEALHAQRKLLDQFSKDSFDFIAVIDTSSTPNPWNLWDSNLRSRAEDIASQFCDDVILMPEGIHENRKSLFPKTKVLKARNSNERASDVLQFILNEKILSSFDPAFIIDSDMFPIAPFCVSESLNECSVRGVFQHRSGRFGKYAKYYWNGIMMFNPSKLENLERFSFDCGKVNGLKVDTGGQSHWWIKSIEDLKDNKSLGSIDHFASLNWNLEQISFQIPEKIFDFIVSDDRNREGKFFTEIYDEKFLHFRAGSNWREEPTHVVRKRNSDFIQACLQL
jgi:hypothetical protein